MRATGARRKPRVLGGKTALHARPGTSQIIQHQAAHSPAQAQPEGLPQASTGPGSCPWCLGPQFSAADLDGTPQG